MKTLITGIFIGAMALGVGLGVAVSIFNNNKICPSEVPHSIKIDNQYQQLLERLDSLELQVSEQCGNLSNVLFN